MNTPTHRNTDPDDAVAVDGDSAVLVRTRTVYDLGTPTGEHGRLAFSRAVHDPASDPGRVVYLAADRPGGQAMVSGTPGNCSIMVPAGFTAIVTGDGGDVSLSADSAHDAGRAGLLNVKDASGVSLGEGTGLRIVTDKDALQDAVTSSLSGGLAAPGVPGPDGPGTSVDASPEL